MPVNGFGKIWDENAKVRDRIGCPTAAEFSLPGAAQERFEGGYMFWRMDIKKIYVFYGNPNTDTVGVWAEYDDTWSDGTPVATTPDTPQSNTPLPFAFKHLDSNHPYLKDRGFTPETIASFGVGYHVGKGIMKGRVVIPIWNVQGDLVAYAGRWPGHEPPEGEGKYKLPPGFHKSLEVFNLHRAKACAREHGLVIVEGYFDVMRLAQSGICHAVALMGSTLSEAQERLIVEAVGSQGWVTLCFDGDQSGQAATEDALQRLSQHVFVKAVRLDEQVQPDDLQEEEIKALFG